jgi:ABC-type nitrate/sulfonate/bicarbonate transport system substrate-binding protein
MYSRFPLLIGIIALLNVGGLHTVGEAKTVRVAVPCYCTQYVAFFAARDNGYYHEEGLDVELIVMGGGVTINALIGGDVHIATLVDATLSAALRGAPLRILFSSYERTMLWLYSKPEINDVKGLKGRKVAVSNLGSATGLFLLEILKRNGLDARRDLITLGMGSPPTRYAALVNGSVDAAMLTEPYNFMAEEGGFRELVSFPKEDLVLLSGSISVREKSLQSDLDLIERFIRGTLKGLFYARENRTGTVEVLKRMMKINDKLATKIYDVFRPGFTRDGTVNDQTTFRVLSQAAKIQGVKEVPSREKFFDYSIVRKVLAEMKAAGWSPSQQ